eukprot:scaffold122364_cov22-Prasinocladus_malaysianus.AAC.1
MLTPELIYTTNVNDPIALTSMKSRSSPSQIIEHQPYEKITCTYKGATGGDHAGAEMNLSSTIAITRH